MDKKKILQQFLNDKFEQIFCEKCMSTFFTNVYLYDDNHVILEKRSLGLEYFCNAIQAHHLSIFPNVFRIGILDEDDNIIKPESVNELFKHEETQYRYIYMMEKLIHLKKEETNFFDKNTKDFEEKTQTEQKKILNCIEKRFGQDLSSEIQELYRYYIKHKEYIAWDLHGDNLMQRESDNKILILDPFALKL